MMTKQVNFQYKIEVPVMVSCHRREDGTVSIDTVSAPDEDEVYALVDQSALTANGAAGI